MSELGERKWAVISERGCEAVEITHQQAVEIERRLAREKVHGLCIVSAEAGKRLKAVMRSESEAASKSSNG